MDPAKSVQLTRSPQRERLLNAVADLINNPLDGRIFRLAVDGIDGAGKTTFSDELAGALQGRSQTVIRASVDAFHNTKAKRYKRGLTSPEGFFRDSYNYDEFKKALLDPLSPGGSGTYRTAIFDLASDSFISTPQAQALPNSIFVLDGIFLHRPELRDYWDFSIFLDVDFNVSVPRMALRDAGSPDPMSSRNRRYVEGQNLYLRECNPILYATVTINNSDLAYPYIFVADNPHH